MAKQEMSAAELYRQERKERLAKSAKKNQKKQNKIIVTKGVKRFIAALVVLAIIGGIAGIAVNTSGVLERAKVAFTVAPSEEEVKGALVTLDESEKISMAEYSYYYATLYSNYFNTAYSYDYYYGVGSSFTGFDYTKSPDIQEFTLEEIEGVENPMWTDYFSYSAIQSIRYVKSCLAYAQEKGIELDENDLASVQSTINSVKESASKNNFSYSAYLRYTFGKAMTPAVLEEICKQQALATKVQEVVTQEYVDGYTDKEVLDAYNKDVTAYGVVSLRNYVITAEKVTVKAEKEGEEDKEEVTKETLAAAKKKAEEFAAKVTDEASFKALAAEYEKAAGSKESDKMISDDSLTLLDGITHADLSYDVTDEDFLKWAFSEKAEAGSTYIVEDETTGYTVYMMVAPVHTPADAPTYDVRHILLQFPEEAETAEEEETEETEESDVKLLDASKYEGVTVDIDVDLEKTEDIELYGKTQDILVEYLEGDKTEDAFSALAAKYSEDGNAADGGIYEDVTLGYMVPEFEGWAMAEGRKYGDVGIVETTYGYHIMYYVGSGVIKWQNTVKDDLAAADFAEFAEELEHSEAVVAIDKNDKVMKAVEEFVVSFAKTQIRNISAQTAG